MESCHAVSWSTDGSCRPDRSGIPGNRGASSGIPAGEYALVPVKYPSVGGDTLTVWRLDRLSRSLKDLIDLVSQLEARGIGLKSLHESIDTTSSSGKLIFHVFGALAEFERNLIRERTQAGLAAARARGRRGGRPKSLDAAKRAIAVNLYDEKKHSVKEICEVMGVSKPTLYKYIQAARTETT